ncbi:MAG: hypothetical protein WEB56_16300 [Roseovarius sp.]
MPQKDYPQTPDGRYFVSRGRLWRCTDPGLEGSERRAAIKALMKARRAVQLAGDDAAAERAARADVDAAKRALGERGPVWWQDGAPDEGGHHPKNSSYAAWWAALGEAEQARGS